MSVRLFRVILPVSDIERATRFYATVFSSPGFRVSGGRHYFECGGVILACYDPRADGDGYEARSNPEWLYFAVDDLDKVYSLCAEAGAMFEPGEVHGDPAGAIAKRPWGERSFYARDPFGNGICFVDQRTVFKGSDL